MKKILALLCVTAALFLGGCKEKKKAEKKEAAPQTEVEKTKKEAKGAEIPVCQADDEKFEFDEGAVKDFNFIADEKNKEAKTNVPAEEEDAALAWNDEKDGENVEFKVVNFDLNRNDIRKDQREKVAEDVKLAQETTKEGKQLVVAGHCCKLGSASFNMSLSERRAKTIKDEMVKNGVNEDKVTIIGCGSEHPVVTSEAKDKTTLVKELAANRRAEISVH